MESASSRVLNRAGGSSATSRASASTSSSSSSSSSFWPSSSPVFQVVLGLAGGVALIALVRHLRKGLAAAPAPAAAAAAASVAPPVPRPAGEPATASVVIASCRELLESGPDGNTEHYGVTGQDEGHLYRALARLGVPVHVRAWDDPSVAWADYSAVVVRTTWDYSSSEARAYEFKRWLARLGDAGVAVYNNQRCGTVRVVECEKIAVD
jgi:hypothetical protein